MSEQEKKVSQMTFDFGAGFAECVPSVPDSSAEEDWEIAEDEFDFGDDPELETETADEIRESMDGLTVEEEVVSASSLEMKTDEEYAPVSESVSKEEAVPENVEEISTPEKTEVPEENAVPCAVCEEAALQKEEKDIPLKGRDLKRAALAFLASLGASAIAKDVPTRGSRFRADAAAFFMEEGSASAGRKAAVRTALAEIRTESEAQIECANHAQQLVMLNAARMEQEMLEQEIRRTEPHLRDDSNLFVEFEHWNYAASHNTAYKECMQKIRDLEYAIFHGSKLSKFHSAGIATELYLVVPEGAVCMETVAGNWGLVFVKKDLSFELVKKPLRYDCPAENLSRMVRNIAASACKEVLFANGISEDKDLQGGRSYKVGSLPRKRRK